MGRKKKATARTPATAAAPPAASNAPESKPRGRGRPRKNAAVSVVADPVVKEESQQSTSTTDEQSQDAAPVVDSGAEGLADDLAAASTASSKKFGKFRILHSASPSSSSGEQPSDFASKSEPQEDTGTEAPEDTKSEAPEESRPEPPEDSRCEDPEGSQLLDQMVAMEVDIEPVAVVITDEGAAMVIATEEEQTGQQQEQFEEGVERLQQLCIDPVLKAEEEDNVEAKVEECPKEAAEVESKNLSSTQPNESSQSGRRRSSRIKVIQESNVKAKPSKEEKESKEKESKEKDQDSNGHSKESADFPTPATPPVCNKPVKVKSRWRRSSELEMGSNNLPKGGSQGGTPSGNSKIQPLSADEERLKSFKKIDKNLYLTQRTTNKETKRMICECEPVDDDEMGCGEDCLNRMLMIECGPRCPLGDKCSNKRFQKMEYSPIEVVRTEKKGFGLQAMADIENGAFLSEYVGEVLDPYEFQRRAEDYANDKNRHYYFMALKSDAIIDATIKGNNSRFINHSCDPNAETQKWTVNGELRIGFFAIKDIAAGDELTFDYQLQRYGKEAQRCYCEAENCRGWIGGDPDKEETVAKKGAKVADKKDKKAKPKPKFYIVQELLEDQDLENEVQNLCNSGLKNRQSTLDFSRLMVRVEDQERRKRLLELLGSAETPCRRLFLDYHGLRLMWSWMVDESNVLRLEIMSTLEGLPISNVSVLQDTKVLPVIEKWEEESRPVESEATTVAQKEENVPEVKEEEEVAIKNEPVEDVQMEEVPEKAEKIEDEKVEEEAEKTAASEEGSAKEGEVAPAEAAAAKALREAERRAAEHAIAKKLLESWKTLPEIFKIPRKVKKEQIKEHEREAERNYQKYLENRGYKAEYSESSDRARKERYRGVTSVSSNSSYPGFKRRDLKDDTRKPRMDRIDDRLASGMNKYERRQLFAQRVEQEERAKREQMWMEQERERRQRLLEQQQQQQPHILMDANGVPCFFNPNTNSWHAYHGPPEAAEKPVSEPPMLLQQPAPVVPALDPLVWQQVMHIPIAPLPPRWKAAYDDKGQPYYYHVRRRVPQWQPPPLIPSAGSVSSSEDSSSSSELDSSAESENEETDSSEAADDDSDEEVQEGEDEAEPCVPGEEEIKLTEQGKKEEAEPKEPRRREGLIRELIIISPRREEDIPTESSKARIRKAKEQLRLEKQAALRKQHQQHRQKDKTRDKQRTIKIKNPGGDLDAETEKKIKEDFLAKMATTVVSTLNPFHRPDCQQGRITCSEDFKYLARKLTNFVMLKELKHCRKVSDLSCNDSVKHKAREYIKKYMAKFGEMYARENERDHKDGHGDPSDKNEED